MSADAQAAVAEAEARPADAGGFARELRRLGGQTLVYGLGGVALQLVGIVTLPIFARVFSPADYGILELGMTVAAILMIVVDFGMASASQRSYFDYGDADEQPRRRVLSTALLFQLLLGSAVAAALIVAAAPISRALFDGREKVAILVLIGLSLPVLAAAQFGREVLRLEFRPWAYLVASVVGAAVGAAVSILAVVSWDAGVEGPFIGGLAGPLAGAVIGIALVHRRVRARPSRRELDVMLRYGVPLIPTALALWALSLIDRLMLSRLANLDEVGQYAIANRLATPVLLAVTALALALSPFVLSIHQEDPQREREVRARVLTDFTAGLCAIALVTALWAREVQELVAPAFDEAFRSAGIVAFGQAAFGVSTVLVAAIAIARKTNWLMLYAGLAAVLNIALNFALIPPFGQVGAAVATLIAYVGLCALYYRRGQVVHHTPYRIGVVVAMFALGLVLMPLGAIAYSGWLLALAVKIAAVGVYVSALLVLRRPRPAAPARG
jgi:O-antigen/teichoic acid export membrane protein